MATETETETEEQIAHELAAGTSGQATPPTIDVVADDAGVLHEAPPEGEPVCCAVLAGRGCTLPRHHPERQHDAGDLRWDVTDERGVAHQDPPEAP